jgi:hypothetical protein
LAGLAAPSHGTSCDRQRLKALASSALRELRRWRGQSQRGARRSGPGPLPTLMLLQVEPR